MAQDPAQHRDPPGPPAGPQPAPPLREFLHARWQLLRLEAREASQVLTARLTVIIAAAAAGVLAYLLLLVTLGWTIAILLAPILPGGQAHWSGPIAAGLLFLLHLIAALVLFTRAKNKQGPPLFEYTRAEWNKDQEWFQKENSPGKNAN